MPDQSPQAPEAVGAAEPAPSNNTGSSSAESAWAGVLGLPCTLSLDLGVKGFKVRHLIELNVQSVVNSHYNAAGHLPVCVNGAKIGTAEFDVLKTRLAIRMSEVE